jgi:protein ImuB
MFCCLVTEPSSQPSPGALDAVARACSPCVHSYTAHAVIFEASGLHRVLGTPHAMAASVGRLGADHGLTLRVAVAETMVTAWLVAHNRSGTTVVGPGETRTAISRLGLDTLHTLPASHLTMPASRGASVPPVGDAARAAMTDLLAVLARWGLRTLGDLARLPRADVLARLGPLGMRLHQAACGEDTTAFVPIAEPPRFVERLELEWPIEGLEPLAFVLSRLLDGLSVALERADRGAVTLTTRLRLVTRRTHERVLHLPGPLRDARVLRTLIVLDLESHPPDAAIDIVEIDAGVTPGRILQGSLLTHARPTVEVLSTLLARLRALMGETRVGAPVVSETHDARAIAMQAFSGNPVGLDAIDPRRQETGPGVRRFRRPLAARVTTDRGTPVRVDPSSGHVPGGRIVMSAGPWRTSGDWWTHGRTGWDRDEWDIELATGVIYRIARDRRTGSWEIEGEVD